MKIGNSSKINLDDSIFTIITFLPVDGVWGNWGAFTTCTQLCGGGTKTRSRNCDNPAPAFGGATCAGSANDQQKCNEDKCPGTTFLFPHPKKVRQKMQKLHLKKSAYFINFRKEIQ